MERRGLTTTRSTFTASSSRSTTLPAETWQTHLSRAQTPLRRERRRKNPLSRRAAVPSWCPRRRPMRRRRQIARRERGRNMVREKQQLHPPLRDNPCTGSPPRIDSSAPRPRSPSSSGVLRTPVVMITRVASLLHQAGATRGCELRRGTRIVGSRRPRPRQGWEETTTATAATAFSPGEDGMTKRYGSCVRGVETADKRLAFRPSAMYVVVTHKKKCMRGCGCGRKCFYRSRKMGKLRELRNDPR